MTTNYLKELFNNPTKTIKFGIKDVNLLLQLEDLLLNNGYRWRGRAENHHYIRDEYMKNNNIYMIILNINYDTDKPKILSMSTYVTNFEIENSTILLTKDSLKKLNLFFNPIPDYSPRKITREI